MHYIPLNILFPSLLLNYLYFVSRVSSGYLFLRSDPTQTDVRTGSDSPCTKSCIGEKSVNKPWEVQILAFKLDNSCIVFNTWGHLTIREQKTENRELGKFIVFLLLKNGKQRKVLFFKTFLPTVKKNKDEKVHF